MSVAVGAGLLPTPDSNLQGSGWLGQDRGMAKVPPQYLAGLAGAERRERTREILRERERGTYLPLPSDVGVQTRRSKWAVLFEQVFNRPPRDVADVARLTRVPKRILQQVYNRGLAAWSTGGHRRGASQHAWAMARVQSFVLGGPTAYGPDRLLAIEAGLI